MGSAKGCLGFQLPSVSSNGQNILWFLQSEFLETPLPWVGEPLNEARILSLQESICSLAFSPSDSTPPMGVGQLLQDDGLYDKASDSMAMTVVAPVLQTNEFLGTEKHHVEYT